MINTLQYLRCALRYAIPMLMILLLSVHVQAQEHPTTDESATTETASSTIQSALLAAARNALKLEDTAGAIFYYNRYLQEQPNDRQVSQELAGVLIQADRPEEAMAVCEKVLLHDPANTEAQKLKAIALSRLGRAREALQLIAELRAKFPDDMELQKTEAGFRALQGDRRFSRDLYKNLLLAGFNNTKDFQEYLELLAADQQWGLLMTTHEEYKARFSQNDKIRFTVLQALLALNQYANVEEIYNEIATPEIQRDAAIIIADNLAASDNLDEAIMLLEPIIQSAATDPNLVVKIALLEAYNRQPVLALNRLDALPQAIQNTKTDVARVKIFWAAGRLTDALAELDRLNLPDSNIEATLARAGLFLDLQREWEIPLLLAKINSDLERSSVPDKKLAWCLSALAHIRAGNIAAARNVINEFKRTEPADLAPHILLVMTEKAARRTKAYANAVAQLGTILRDYHPGIDLIRPALLDNIPAAAWRIAMNTRPSNSTIILKLANAAMREGRIHEAEQAYDQAVLQPETLVDGRLGLAACALRRRDPQTARYQAEALKDCNMNFSKLIAAAHLMIKAGFDGLADSFYSRITPAQQNHPDARTVRAAWLIRTGRTREAIETIAQTQPATPAETGLLIHQLQCLASLAKNASDPIYLVARERLMALAGSEKTAGGLDASLAAADTLIAHNEYQTAAKLLEYDDYAINHDLRACERLLVVNIRMGDYKNAERHIRAILAKRPGSADQRVLLARMRVWQHDYATAWQRYDELAMDYPEDELIRLEREAKRTRALERHRRSSAAYAAYVQLEPGDREIAVENGDSWGLRDFSRAATDRYLPASWAFPEDDDLQQSLAAARRAAHWGIFGTAEFLQRSGKDRKVDIETAGFEGGVSFPRGPDSMVLQASAGLLKFKFDDTNAPSLNSRSFSARGSIFFTNGIEIAGAFQMLDHQSIDTAWRANLDLGYKGLDGWKIAMIASREDMRENYYSILNEMKSYSIGLYAQWQPTERLSFFGQYRVIEIPKPDSNAIVPTNFFSALTTQTVNRVKTVVPTPADSTWENNIAYEGVFEASYQLFFSPYSLRAWANVYRYDTEKDNDLYWTPEDAFVSGQAGLHWRHTLGARQFHGSALFYYGAYLAIGRNTEGDSSPTLKGELGWKNSGGWSFAAEGGKVWGEKYEETSALARLNYRF